MEERMLLREPDVFPSDEVLRRTLGDPVYRVLAFFLETITSEAYGLTVEWRFYNDGKAWLGKVRHKQKTVCWLSVWNGFFKTSFYFTAKHRERIASLHLAESVKEEFARTEPAGKLIPMIFDVDSPEQTDDLLTIVRFKKSLK